MVEVRRIKPVRAELKRFVQYQIDLYKGSPWFVPPLVFDEINTLDPRKNPAFDFCEGEYFMAWRDGKPAGRIAAIINRQLNEKQGTRTARFGWVDFDDDPEVVSALFGAAEEWARSRGMNRMIGPLGFTDLDKEGCLIEGFEELSTMNTIYNHPYYAGRIAELGYEKDSDWLEYVMDVPEGIPEKYDRIAEIVKKKYGLRVLKYTSKKQLKKDYGHALFELINESYADLYGYSPLTERQIDYYIKMYLSMLNLDLITLVVDRDDRLVSVGISMPSMSRALQKSKGKIFPTGWRHLLKGLNGPNDRVDLFLVAVKPEYQSKGVNALLFQDLIPRYIAKGYRWAESNPEMETNSKVQSQWDYFSRRQHRRRRSYAKALAPAPEK